MEAATDTLIDLIKSESQFSFRFDGKSEIDAVLLSKTIIDIIELIKCAAIDECPDAEIKIQIINFRSGSFQVVFSTISEAVQGLYRPAASAGTLALKLINIVKGYLKIKKLLRGKQPRSIAESDESNIVIESATGDKITVPTKSKEVIFKADIDRYTIQISEKVMEHSPDNGFTIMSHDEVTEFTSEDVQIMSEPICTESDRFGKSEVIADLRIRKPDLLKNTSWQFIFLGKSINAKIIDDNFVKNIQSGKVNFKSGCYIRAKLEITFYRDSMGEPIDGTEKYTVIHVFGGIVRYEAEQLTIQD